MSNADRIAELDKATLELRELVPDAVNAFGALSKAAQTPVVQRVTARLSRL